MIFERVRNTTEERFMRTVSGYSSVVTDGGSIQLAEGKTTYAMYPVWILNTTWNGERYMFAMNGQTGKFVGNLPVDKSLMKKYFFKMFGIVSAVVFALYTLIWFI